MSLHGSPHKSYAVQVSPLLSLPEEILQNIASHFPLDEWVKGPAKSCHRLHSLHLPRIDLSCFRTGHVSHESTHPVPPLQLPNRWHALSLTSNAMLTAASVAAVLCVHSDARG